MEYKRTQYKILLERIKQPNRFIQVLVGPRQVGKTTIVRQICDEIKIPFEYVIAGKEDDASKWITQHWESARLKLESTNKKSFLLIIDEIQKINDWSETVKQLWDTDTFNGIDLKVILLGSSGLMLQQGLNESLAGRFELLRIPHWSYNEMNKCFGLNHNQFAWYGGYPGSMAFIKSEKRWKDYVRNALIEATISKDVILMTNIHKPALMKQVFEMGTLYSSKMLSYNKMIGQLQDAGNTVTIAHYLKLLDTAGLLTGLEKYFIEKHRTKSSSPKWQVKNTALFSALSNETFKQVSVDSVKWGQVVENAVGAHLINMADEGGYEVMYWRHVNDEVDFVLRKGEEIVAIEVKSSFSRKTKGMQVFDERFKPNKMLMIGNSGLKWQEFLEIDPGLLFKY